MENVKKIVLFVLFRNDKHDMNCDDEVGMKYCIELLLHAIIWRSEPASEFESGIGNLAFGFGLGFAGMNE